MLSSCLSPLLPFSIFFFFNDTAPTEIYTLPLHDALPICAVPPYCDDGAPADEVTLGSLPLKVGESLRLTYDFGDNWQFDVKLERIDPPGSVKKLPKLLEIGRAHV